MSPYERLENFVRYKHRNQMRKYSGVPYYIHLKNVSLISSKCSYSLCSIGLCHDLLEDTDSTENELAIFLLSIGYSCSETDFIVSCVVELTDEFTKEKYPELNRAERKERERNRLSAISPSAQTVKYADIIDNCRDISEHDPNFSKVYLEECSLLLETMNKGNKELYDIALETIRIAKL